MIYLCKSGRSYDIPQEVYDEIVLLKTKVAAPSLSALPSSSEVPSQKKGGSA